MKRAAEAALRVQVSSSWRKHDPPPRTLFVLVLEPAEQRKESNGKQTARCDEAQNIGDVQASRFDTWVAHIVQQHHRSQSAQSPTP